MATRKPIVLITGQPAELPAADSVAVAAGELAATAHAATSKATPVDADELPLVDSAASNVLKTLTWANLKAALGALYATISHAATAHGYTGQDKIVGNFANELPVGASLIMNFNQELVDETGLNTPAATGTPVYNALNALGGAGNYSLQGEGAATNYVTVPSNARFELGAGEFAIAFNYRDNTTTDPYARIVVRDRDNNGGGWAFWVDGGNITFGYDCTDSPGTWNMVSCGAVSTSVFHHFAAIREGNTVRTFRDGAQVATSDITGKTLTASTAPLAIMGFLGYANRNAKGFIDNLLIIKGNHNEWTAAGFTPPTTERSADPTVREVDCTAAGRAIIDDADAAAQRATLGLGGAALLAVGTAAGTVAAGDDSRLTNARTPTSHASSHISTGGDAIAAAVAAGASGLLTGADKTKLDSITLGAANGNVPTRPAANAQSADTISEITAAAGVTVDGLLIKDGGLSSASNADISITPNGTGSVVIGDKPLKTPWLQDIGEIVNALGNCTGAKTIDLTAGNVVTGTTTGETTWTWSNPTATGKSCTFTLILTNGGSAAQIWPSGAVKWPAGTAPTLTASGVDILVFTTIDAGTTWYGVLSGAAFA